MDTERAAKLRLTIERAKQSLSSRFDLIHAAMRGQFMANLYSANIPSAKAQIELDAALARIGSPAAEIEKVQARATSLEILDQVEPTTLPFWYDRAIAAYQRDVVRQIGRDAKSVSNLFSKVQTAINTLPSNKHLAAKAQALQHVNGPGVFVYKDSIGKRWTAKRYLETFASQNYYGLANDLISQEMSFEGLTNAILDRPGHVSDGTVVSLANLGNIRRQYFHPGSQAILT